MTAFAVIVLNTHFVVVVVVLDDCIQCTVPFFLYSFNINTANSASIVTCVL